MFGRDKKPEYVPPEDSAPTTATPIPLSDSEKQAFSDALKAERRKRAGEYAKKVVDLELESMPKPRKETKVDKVGGFLQNAKKYYQLPNLMSSDPDRGAYRPATHSRSPSRRSLPNQSRRSLTSNQLATRGRHCTNCGTEILPRERFCPHCGESVR